MVHRNAPLSETGRLRLARCIVEDGWPLRRAAERFQVSVNTARGGRAATARQGEAGMADRSSRPHHSPNRTPTRTERRIIGVRVIRRWGPARIGYLLGLNPSTVHSVLTRYRIAKLRWLDRATGRVVRRMESARAATWCTSMSRNSARSPPAAAGGCWAAPSVTATPGRQEFGRCNKLTGNPVRGYHFVHTAIDAHSRLAYTEMLADERKETAAEFWQRANTWFTNAASRFERC